MKRLSTALALAAVLAATPALAAPVLEPTTQHFLNGLAAAHVPAIPSLSPHDARALLDGAQGSVKVAAPFARITDRVLPVGPTGSTRIRIYRPSNASSHAPAIVYYHGAGWVMGGPTSHDRLVRDLAAGSGAVVIFVDYERSPEARYPTAIEQDYAVLDHVARYPAEFGIDPSRIAIAGDSVGGNMVAVVSALVAERHGPKPVAQVLFYPVTDAAMNDGSYREFANGPWLTAKAMEYFWNQYLPAGTDRAQPHVSPLNTPDSILHGQAPALVITDENDVLRDEGEAYARRLIEADVPVTTTRYNATIHDFVMLNALARTPAATAAIAQATHFLRDAFAQAK
ncbi:acetyl esterase [Endobacter medicaginis]|uniref:Acetyl esterase n=1 Tax=Endobacter medicaginis TaxID=1181271 RepID=A0A839V091_9PROT|nr:alpha/beta hydrolase [Endobacter medicaginis]MBB3175567.1 acetyl esterase [Endobacter medicaginis]MCX5477239.1 alpha/beta hydrolase [Endobacter medicaginis]NVN30564.1 alpha/beta hydrolase [Endobacter medicaginis]